MRIRLSNITTQRGFLETPLALMLFAAAFLLRLEEAPSYIFLSDESWACHSVQAPGELAETGVSIAALVGSQYVLDLSTQTRVCNDENRDQKRQILS